MVNRRERLTFAKGLVVPNDGSTNQRLPHSKFRVSCWERLDTSASTRLVWSHQRPRADVAKPSLFWELITKVSL